MSGFVSTCVSIIVDGGIDYRVAAANTFGERLTSFCEVIRAVIDSQRSVDVLLFPAGYFCTSQSSQVSEVAERVSAQLKELDPPFVVVWGIDGWTEEAKQDALCSDSGYPFFVFVRVPSRVHAIRFQQVATSAAEGRSQAMGSRWSGRSTLIEGTQAALLICGECWSDELLEKVRTARPKVLLIPAHRNVNLSGGMSRRSWHLRLKRFSEGAGIPILLAEHSRSPWRHAYSWGGEQLDDVPLPPSLGERFSAKALEI